MILQEKLRPYRLLLASHSPRRQQLLRDCGLDYTLIDLSLIHISEPTRP